MKILDEAKLCDPSDIKKAFEIRNKAAEKLNEAYYLISDLIYYSNDESFEDLAQKVLDINYEVKSLDFE